MPEQKSSISSKPIQYPDNPPVRTPQTQRQFDAEKFAEAHLWLYRLCIAAAAREKREGAA